MWARTLGATLTGYPTAGTVGRIYIVDHGCGINSLACSLLVDEPVTTQTDRKEEAIENRSHDV